MCSYMSDVHHVDRPHILASALHCKDGATEEIQHESKHKQQQAVNFIKRGGPRNIHTLTSPLLSSGQTYKKITKYII